MEKDVIFLMVLVYLLIITAYFVVNAKNSAATTISPVQAYGSDSGANRAISIKVLRQQLTTAQRTNISAIGVICNPTCVLMAGTPIIVALDGPNLPLREILRRRLLRSLIPSAFKKANLSGGSI